MTSQRSERRMTENEAVFRQFNEQVQHGVKELKAMAEKEGHQSLLARHNTPLHFYCECAEEACTERIRLTPSTYTKIHKNRKQFVILPGHEVAAIEKIVETKPDYLVVLKDQKPPERPMTLHNTPLSNN
ncbi:MAG: hypothetical protein WAQ24_01960 [Candidatus Saccharimonadales bacterium]